MENSNKNNKNHEIVPWNWQLFYVLCENTTTIHLFFLVISFFHIFNCFCAFHVNVWQSIFRCSDILFFFSCFLFKYLSCFFFLFFLLSNFICNQVSRSDCEKIVTFDRNFRIRFSSWFYARFYDDGDKRKIIKLKKFVFSCKLCLVNIYVFLYLLQLYFCQSIISKYMPF